MLYGITEEQFWNMTIAELERAVRVEKKKNEFERKQRAIDEYRFADLIGISVSRSFSKENRMPQIAEVYPDLFDTAEVQEAKKQKQTELSALRFIHFAQSHNSKFKREEEQKVNE